MSRLLTHISTFDNEIEICKTFRFEAAHDLPYHDGKCKNRHGHSYKVVICCVGKPQEVSEDNPESGMVIDFYKISDIWKEIEKKLDHQDLNRIIPYPTAEHIALYVQNYFHNKLLHTTVRISRIRVHETENSYVEVVGL